MGNALSKVRADEHRMRVSERQHEGHDSRKRRGPRPSVAKTPATCCRKIRKYIVDSGATCHLVCEEDLTKTETATKWKTTEGQRLNTANGNIIVWWMTTIYIHDLRATVDAWILSNCPSVLSLGKICRDLKKINFLILWNKKK